MFASQVIEKLQKLIAEHGDRPCYSGGSEIPAMVDDIWFYEEGGLFYEPKCFTIE